jgi:glutamate dehydrogenase
MHIFLDPSPDPKATLKERERLFALPRSGWNDYNAKLISKGGGIFPRSQKEIPLSAEVKTMLGLTQASASPAEIIKAMLRAPVDLLFFGGIGTYVKASDESNADAGDRANDALRVNGDEVRAKVTGEGANLGVTQRARIEYALGGGRINQDSIDNSAGVDCSDHEVNIKILLGAVVAGKKLTMRARNGLLARMTDDVAALCLSDNYLQTQAISVSEFLGVRIIDAHQRLIKMLERLGDLDRAVEFLPDDETITGRLQAGRGMTRPEIGVLLSYAKNWLTAELEKSSYPDDLALEGDLLGYFPPLLAKRYVDAINKHRLRREIISTVAANALVNRAGETFVSGLIERTGMAAPMIARAFTIARRVFELDGLWAEIEGLDNKVPAQVQIEMLLAINQLVDWATLWFLRHGGEELDIGSHVERFADGIAALAGKLDEVLPAHYLTDLNERAALLVKRGAPKHLAGRIAGLVNLFSAPDIVALAARRKMAVPAVGKLYFATGSRFRLGRLRAAAEKLESGSHWQKLAVDALIEETYAHQLALAAQVIDAAKKGMSAEKAVEAWVDSRKAMVEQTDRLLADLWSTSISDISMVAVASRQLRALASS